MELEINPKAKTMLEGLGLTEEKAEQLCKSVMHFVGRCLKEKGGADRLDTLEYAASSSENLREYTLLAIHLDSLIEAAQRQFDEEQREEHEKNCPRCRARKAEERYGVFGTKIFQNPSSLGGTIVIRL